MYKNSVFFALDLTAVCLLEGFNNPDWMVHADRVLKSIGKEKASKHFKVILDNLVLPSVALVTSARTIYN